MAKPLRVLLVADAADDAIPLLLDELRRGDYELQVERVDTAAAMRAALEAPAWDVILAGYALQHFSASAALAVLRDSGLDIPCLVITDAEENESLRTALTVGGHDCIRLQNLARLVPAVEREMRAARVRAARALTEAALREAEARYRLLVEQLPVGVHVMALDADGSTLSISPPLERILGFSLAEWVADPQLWRRQIHAEDRERALAELAHVYTPGAGPAIAEYRMLARDGRVVWIRDETLLVRDAAGQPRYLQSVKLDITTRKRSEAEAEALQRDMSQWVKELEQANREMALVTELAQMLQGCRSADEAFRVAADFIPLLFPAESGALYRLTPSTPDRLERAAAWGRFPPAEAELARDDCLALRRSRPVAADVPFSGQACAHLGEPAPMSTLCVPLSAQGETLGMLHLRLRRNTGELRPPDALREALTEPKQRLAATVAEQLALVLANLKRQAELQARVDSAELAAGDANGTEAAELAAQVVVGPLVLNCRTFELWVGDRVVNPTPVEFDLLQFLMRNAGKVFTAEQLLQEVWRYPPGTGSQELVRAHVKNLRAKLEPNPRRPVFLKTIGRFGYTITPGETPEPEQA
mgnify:CR=1 FL=1